MSTNLSLHPAMQYDETSVDELVKSLADNFDILADEVQTLSDKKTILEHKLRFAHEQYQRLADKYTPSDTDIAITLAKLQLPPELKLHSPEQATFVPLPSRRPAGSKQQTAEAIRDGRRASKKLTALRGWRNPSDLANKSSSGTLNSIVRTSGLGTSATSAFEQDFTVPGKRSELSCPFTRMANKGRPFNSADACRPTSESMSGPELKSHRPITASEVKPTIHPPSADPICAALYSESHPSPPPSVTGSAAKCPIRFLDQHSPEEVARYFETHKHEIPRSHEVCVKRYQRNEEDIRKLDAKYGNLVSMISGLGQKHQPMLQVKEEDFADRDVEKRPNERVQNWAKEVSADEISETGAIASPVEDDEDREGRFDRPMKEVRVGESPSRPWGISVPHVEQTNIQESARRPEDSLAWPPKPSAVSHHPESAKKCPFDHEMKPKNRDLPRVDSNPVEGTRPQPAFIQTPGLSNTVTNSGPQMIFTGPVFIGYPIEQAMAFMQQWQGGGPSGGKQ